MEEPMSTNKIPQTDSIHELAQFWDTHDLTDFEEQLEASLAEQDDTDKLVDAKDGEIKELKLQVLYNLSINGIKICDYFADFTYVKDGEFIVEDAKGKATKEYILKRKMMKAIHGVTILETRKTK